MAKISIIGAGMAGLLAGVMLAPRHKVRIYESAQSLPNNHSAVLRFRSDIVSDVTGIPFRKVQVIKSVDDVLFGGPALGNDIANMLAYSMKCTGTYRTDRSLPLTTEISERYIAPPDFIGQLGHQLRHLIRYGEYWQPGDDTDLDNVTISTVPMPFTVNSAQALKEFRRQPFITWPGINVRAVIEDCDAYCTLYVPDPSDDFSRITVTGNELIIEFPRHPKDDANDSKWWEDPAVLESIARKAAGMLGLDRSRIGHVTAHIQQYAKIAPIPENTRREIMYTLTDELDIYSLGRYATWRPGLLLDDLVKDIRLIERWIGDKYAIRRHR